MNMVLSIMDLTLYFHVNQLILLQCPKLIVLDCIKTHRLPLIKWETWDLRPQICQIKHLYEGATLTLYQDNGSVPAGIMSHLAFYSVTIMQERILCKYLDLDTA